MKTIISKKLASSQRTTETVGGVERLKDKELRGIAGGGGKIKEIKNKLKDRVVVMELDTTAQYF